MTSRRQRPGADLLLGEWACLGILHGAPAHGFAVAARLKPDGDIGRIWSLSRALTYRSLDQLSVRELIRPVGEEPGIAGGNRTILAATPRGRALLRRWLATPVAHVRDLRAELLLKIVLAEQAGIDIGDMLRAQRALLLELTDALDETLDEAAADRSADVVTLWRTEATHAALRFLDRLIPPAPHHR